MANKSLTFGILIMVLSIVLSIIMMAVNGWVGSCKPSRDSDVISKCHIGLRVMTYDQLGDGVNVQSLTLPGGCRDAPNLEGGGPYDPKFCTRWFDGGTIILATGIISYVVFMVSVVLLVIAHRRIISNYRYFGLFGLYVSSGLMVLGIVLYANKQFAGYSFILMVVAGFLYFIGVGLVSAGGWDLKAKAGANAEGH